MSQNKLIGTESGYGSRTTPWSKYSIQVLGAPVTEEVIGCGYFRKVRYFIAYHVSVAGCTANQRPPLVVLPGK